MVTMVIWLVYYRISEGQAEEYTWQKLEMINDQSSANQYLLSDHPNMTLSLEIGFQPSTATTQNGTSSYLKKNVSRYTQQFSEFIYMEQYQIHNTDMTLVRSKNFTNATESLINIDLSNA